MLSDTIKKLKSGAHLGEEEAAQTLQLILSEDFPDQEIETLLLALADKGEHPDEITGFAKVMRDNAVTISCDHDKYIDTAGTGGGTDTFNISTAAAFVIAGAGLPVAKHGNRAVTSRSGSADVLLELGVSLDQTSEIAEKALNQIGLCFMFAPQFHPAMKRVARIRQKLKRRTIFNLLGPLTNPASAPFQIVGVYSADLTDKLAEALKRLGCSRAWVVHGEDGLDEISISAQTHISEVKDGQVQSFDFTPLEMRLGIPKGGSPKENARLIAGILNGTITGPARDVVVLNAAAALHISGLGGLSQALALAEESLHSGKALEKLKQLESFYGRSNQNQ